MESVNKLNYKLKQIIMKKLAMILGVLLLGGTVFGAVANPKQERNAAWLQESSGSVSHIYIAM